MFEDVRRHVKPKAVWAWQKGAGISRNFGATDHHQVALVVLQTFDIVTEVAAVAEESLELFFLLDEVVFLFSIVGFFDVIFQFDDFLNRWFIAVLQLIMAVDVCQQAVSWAVLAPALFGVK